MAAGRGELPQPSHLHNLHGPLAQSLALWHSRATGAMSSAFEKLAGYGDSKEA